MSLQTDDGRDLNPNDSYFFNLQNNATQMPTMLIHPSGYHIYSSSGTNPEALSLTKSGPVGHEIDEQSSHLWLNEELDPNQQENRIR